MRLPRLWLTPRAATIIRYSAIVIFLTVFALGYFNNLRRDRPMSLIEVASVGDVQVFVVTEGGSDPSSFYPIRAEAPPDMEWRAYFPLLKAELGIYTARMLGESGLRSVVLCQGLTEEGREASGLASYGNKRIYLAVPRPLDSKDFARRVVHHELFHLIDLRHGDPSGSDPNWTNLNEGAFRYGQGGKHERTPDATLPDESVAGFLNRYSRSDVGEDKAEIYAHLMAGMELIERRSQGDVVLRSKCKELKNRLSRYFPEMNPRFWEKGHESRLD